MFIALSSMGKNLGFKHLQSIGNGLVHIPVAVRAEASAEDEIRHLRRFFRILRVHFVVARVVYGIVGFVALLVGFGVFPADHRFVQRKGFFAFRVIVLELMQPREGHFHIRIVHHRGALVILHRQRFPFKTQGTPFQFPVPVLEKLVRHTGVNDRAVGRNLRLDALVIAVQLQRDERVFQHTLEDAEVAVLRHPLPGIVEVVGIVGGAERQAADDGRGQFARVVFTLLVRISIDERLIQGASDKGYGLFLKVLRLRNEVARYLRFQKCRSLRRTEVFAVKGVDGAQVDGHGVHPALVGNEHLVLIAGEFPELVDVFPYLGKRGVEDVRTVAVAFNARFLIQRGMAVAADMAALVDDRHRLFHHRSNALGNGSPPETGTYDKVLHETPLVL